MKYKTIWLTSSTSFLSASSPLTDASDLCSLSTGNTNTRDTETQRQNKVKYKPRFRIQIQRPADLRNTKYRHNHRTWNKTSVINTDRAFILSVLVTCRLSHGGLSVVRHYLEHFGYHSDQAVSSCSSNMDPRLAFSFCTWRLQSAPEPRPNSCQWITVVKQITQILFDIILDLCALIAVTNLILMRLFMTTMSLLAVSAADCDTKTGLFSTLVLYNMYSFTAVLIAITLNSIIMIKNWLFYLWDVVKSLTLSRVCFCPHSLQLHRFTFFTWPATKTIKNTPVISRVTLQVPSFVFLVILHEVILQNKNKNNSC